MDKKSEVRVSFTCRLSPAAAKRIKGFLRDNAGKPAYLRSGTFCEGALLREIDHFEKLMKQKDGISEWHRNGAVIELSE